MMRPGETLDQWRERMADKAAKQRPFVKGTLKARESSYKARQPVETPEPKPKAEPRVRPSRITRPDNCAECGIGMYSRSEGPVAGKREFAGNGLCVNCSQRARRKNKPRTPKPRGRPVRRPTHCVKCGIELISRGGEKRPGVRRHGGHGKCTVCYNKENK